MLQEHYPNRLCYLRKRHQLSQKQLAGLIRKDPTMISLYERGHVVPTFATAAMFQLLFETNVADIFPQLFRKLQKELEGNRRSVRIAAKPFTHAAHDQHH